MEMETWHWDYVMREMAWLASDFQKERQRHIGNGKRIAKAVLTYHKTKEARKEKKIKDEIMNVKRVSSKISRDVRKFWLKINKLIAFKQKGEADEIRQKAMDKHLVFLVKQTERYTNMLVENMQSSGDLNLGAAVSGSKRKFQDSEDSSLNPTKKAGSNKLHEEEADVPIEYFRQRYSQAESDGEENSDVRPNDGSDDDNEEYLGSDENESEEEECNAQFLEAVALETKEGRAEELRLLQEEAGLSIEKLREKYSNLDDVSDEEDGKTSCQGSASDEVDLKHDVSKEESQFQSEISDDNIDEEELSEEDYEDENRNSDSDAADAEAFDADALAEDTKQRREELDMLELEAEMPIDELRAKYLGLENGNHSEESEDSCENDEAIDDATESISGFMKSSEMSPAQEVDFLSEDDDYSESAASEGVAAEEVAFESLFNEENSVEREDEIAQLQADTEVPLEQLRAQYADLSDLSESSDSEPDNSMETSQQSTGLQSDEEVDSEFCDEDAENDSDQEREDEANFMVVAAEDSDGDRNQELQELEDDANMPLEDLKKKYGIENGKSYEASDSKGIAARSAAQDALARLEDADARARSVFVERPFLLSRKLHLREYQHIGLNWLVSMHQRRLNGILADEMGLGKTIQTIALLAYLAAFRGLWGPHLIVVPTSCIINWEAEFKRWCPAFKVLTYYGSNKARKGLRTGWSKLNSFHVCVTSYQLVVQDSSAFRRKRWYYMILDEAHNIKNFKSQRWQTLLNFNTQRRLLLTGTPLQNNLMELWSLMHFLMPHVFRSRKEFSYWFSNPLNSMVEGSRSVNNDVIASLHSIMRPFLLRRLKKDVAKQLPGKFEHVVMCQLSKRQLFLYEEFMARSTTKALMSGGNYLGMMNILMQLRKVCNHPDLFEPRPITSPFFFPTIDYAPGNLVTSAMLKEPLNCVSEGFDQFWSLGEDHYCQMYCKKHALSIEQAVFVEDVNLDVSPVILSRPPLLAYAHALKEKLQQRRESSMRFNAKISSWRCNRPTIRFNRSVADICNVTCFSELLGSKQSNPLLTRHLPCALHGLVKTVSERRDSCIELIENFVFVIPKILAQPIQMVATSRRADGSMNDFAMTPLKTRLKEEASVFYPSFIRQRIFFPDRKLVQFDSGKLQTLDILLRNLKKDGHKCLIFTQMSKMLDILEVFLNIHAHSYVRLDGSTSVDKRQKLMDRFNSDPKLFCFILSTRSGGLGINLTGADTVIFYDSDWNPAMDAQAQDRAHRIGQTRDVHIYRLICASSVEENILTKARQKQHLDYLVMTEGNFSESSLFSARGLQDVLGIASNSEPIASTNSSNEEDSLKRSEVEAAMAAAEDEDDLSALRVVKSEVAQEQQEFDENGSLAPLAEDDGAEEEDEEDEEGEDGKLRNKSTKSADKTAETSSAVALPVVDAAAEERDMEAEFNSWQQKVGGDFHALESALRPIERFAVRFRQDVENYKSTFALSEQQRLESVVAEAEELNAQWDLEEIERQKEEDEYRALSEGELLAADLETKDIPSLRKWYLHERHERMQIRRKRQLTGEAWTMYIDQITHVPFWYNEDTGAATYATPKLIEEKNRYKTALERGFVALSIEILQHIFRYLIPYPDRMAAQAVCARWREAASSDRFYRRVLSIETGAKDAIRARAQKKHDSSQSKSSSTSNVEKDDATIILGENTYISIELALKAAFPGDTIVLGPGHHWEEDLFLEFPVRFIGETDDPARCVVELKGSIHLTRRSGTALFSGITLSRPRKLQSDSPLIILSRSTVQLFGCIVSNNGVAGPCLSLGRRSTLRAYSCTIRDGTGAGVYVSGVSSLYFAYSAISNNKGSGIQVDCSGCNLLFEDCYVQDNDGGALQFGVKQSEGFSMDSQQKSVSPLPVLDLTIRKVEEDVPNVALFSHSEIRGNKLGAIVAIPQEGTSQRLLIPPLVFSRCCVGDEKSMTELKLWTSKSRSNNENVVIDLADDEKTCINAQGTSTAMEIQ